MISVKKSFTILRSQLGKKFRVENNNLDISALIADSGFDAVTLGSIAHTHRDERNRRATEDTSFRYVQISDIDVTVGQIKSYTNYLGRDAPNNARRLMRKGEILVSTRRPTRGAIVSVPDEFDGHICSVFFSSVRLNNPDEVDPRYIALFLRTSLGRFQFQSMITETAYPVIADDDVENVVILLPDYAVQREMADRYEASVVAFFDQLNSAHTALMSARQEVETSLLGAHAEVLAVPRFGLLTEIEQPDEEQTDGTEAEEVPLSSEVG